MPPVRGFRVLSRLNAFPAQATGNVNAIGRFAFSPVIIPSHRPAVPAVTNISCYRFARMDGLKSLRDELIDFCKERTLKGTILLAPEGIN